MQAAPPPEVEAVIVYPPRLAPLAGDAAFAVVEIGPEALKAAPRPRTPEGAAEPTRTPEGATAK